LLRSKWAVGKAVRAGLAVGAEHPAPFYAAADLVLCRRYQNGAGRDRSGGRRTAAGPFSSQLASVIFARSPGATGALGPAAVGPLSLVWKDVGDLKAAGQTAAIDPIRRQTRHNLVLQKNVADRSALACSRMGDGIRRLRPHRLLRQ
jgi:hypothetical protein